MNPSFPERALSVFPGGVNSPVRAFRSVGGTMLVARRAHGPWLETEDGRRFVDFCMSFGPLILGHAHPEVVAAVTRAAANGTSYALTTAAEIELGETIREAIPTIEKIRLVNSGTEACMTAIRLARAATGRNKILKFSGCYHGHADGLLVRAGSGVAGLAAATSAGIPPSLVQETLVARFNHIEDVERIMGEYGRDVAGIIFEPIPANVGLLEPEPGFWTAVHRIAKSHGALVIWDEVITGFRLTWGSCRALEPETPPPDLICLGKIIGGGLPVGAVGGRSAVMELLAPLGPVYQAGTLSGNPVAVAAGLATLRVLRRELPYDRLAQQTREYLAALRALANEAGVEVALRHRGSIWSVFFTPHAPKCFEDIPPIHAERFRIAFHQLLREGVYLPPSAYEVAFMSTAHTEDVLESTLPAWRHAFEALGNATTRGDVHA